MLRSDGFKICPPIVSVVKKLLNTFLLESGLKRGLFIYYFLRKKLSL
jgi:hypothetical protein